MQTTTSYRVMVKSIVSNDGDVRTWCYAGAGRGICEPIAKRTLQRVEAMIGQGVVLKAWMEEA